MLKTWILTIKSDFFVFVWVNINIMSLSGWFIKDIWWYNKCKHNVEKMSAVKLVKLPQCNGVCGWACSDGAKGSGF